MVHCLMFPIVSTLIVILIFCLPGVTTSKAFSSPRVCCSEGHYVADSPECVDFRPLLTKSEDELSDFEKRVRAAVRRVCQPYVTFASIPVEGSSAVSSEPPVGEELLPQFCTETLGNGAIRRKRPRKLYDMFCFDTEFTILDIRLRELQSEVSAYILVESDVSHSGISKKRAFFPVRTSYSGFPIRQFAVNLTNEVVESLVIEKWIEGWAWKRDTVQRDLGVLGMFDANDEDYVINSDLDEFVTKRIAQALRWCDFPTTGKDDGIITIPLKTYYYNVGCRFYPSPTEPSWDAAKVVSYAYWKASPSTFEMRKARPERRLPFPAGWHLSYFGGNAQVQRKLQRSSHTEFGTSTFTNMKWIESVTGNCFDIVYHEIQGKSMKKSARNKFKPVSYTKIKRRNVLMEVSGDLAFLPEALKASPREYAVAFPTRELASWVNQVQQCYDNPQPVEVKPITVRMAVTHEGWLNCCPRKVLRIHEVRGGYNLSNEDVASASSYSSTSVSGSGRACWSNKYLRAFVGGRCEGHRSCGFTHREVFTALRRSFYENENGMVGERCKGEMTWFFMQITYLCN